MGIAESNFQNITSSIISDHHNAPVNALGYQCVMFTIKIIHEIISKITKQGAKLVGEVAQYENSYRLCYIRGTEEFLIGLAEEIGNK